jgi:hypothetical protein
LKISSFYGEETGTEAECTPLSITVAELGFQVEAHSLSAHLSNIKYTPEKAILITLLRK